MPGLMKRARVTGIPSKHTEIIHSFFINYSYFFNATCSTCSFSRFNCAGCRSGLMKALENGKAYVHTLFTVFLKFFPKQKLERKCVG